MSSSAPAAPFSSASLLEELEARIAPAAILAGPAAFGGQEYSNSGTPFKAASTAPISGPSLNFDATHFFLDLKSGDTLKVYNSGSSFTDFVKVTGGRAYAFFFDKNSDSIPQANELTGLALSEGAKISVSGNVDGDILATLNSKTGVFSTNDLVSNKQSIAGLTVGGDITGSVIAGGNLSNINVGKVLQVKSGTATSFAFDLGGTGAGVGVGEGTIAPFNPGVKQTGGSLSNITVTSADQISAGNGGASGLGGSINGVKVIADSNGILIAGGRGGDGISTSANGGAGGKVSQVVFYGTADTTSANDLVSITGGAGGAAFAGSTGTGAAGGSVDKIWVGYEYNSAKQIVESPNILRDDILVAGGRGGDGLSSGNGGSASSVTLLSAPPESSGLNAEIRVQGGDAGDLFALGKKAGSGGSITTLKIKNLDPTFDPSEIEVLGGNASNPGSVPPVAGTPGLGGSITNPVAKAGEEWFVGRSFAFVAGSGSSTNSGGGNGGSVSNLQFGSFANIVLQNLSITAGTGGNGQIGSGGAGGNISGVNAPLAALDNLVLLAGPGGDSVGDGLKGAAGGRGGSLSNAQFFDLDEASLLSIGALAGSGGDGFAGGGAGGTVNGFSYFGNFASASILGGSGGDVTGTKGLGGSAGGVTGAAFASSHAQDPLNVQSVAVIGGNGGKGPNGGGAGGSITNSNVQTVDSVTIAAGIGGSAGNKGKIGAGGSVGSSNSALGVSAKSSGSNVVIAGGDAGGALMGTTPSTGAAGGSIQNAVASAFGNITFDAGDGSIGGSGGDIVRIGFYGESGPGDAPTGNVILSAGTGGDAILPNGAAGRGGNLTTASGYAAIIDVGLYTSSAIDATGNQHIAYYDATLGDLKYALFDGATWTITTVDSEGDVGEFTSLKLSSTNRPSISYYDVTNGDLKLASFNGSTWDIQTVTSAGDVGQYSSLVLDASNNPAIAYYNASVGDLQFARNTGSWAFSTVDSEGDAGRYASLAYDPTLDVFHTSYNTNSGSDSLNYAQSSDGGVTWETWADIYDPASPPFFGAGLHTSIAVESAGNVGITYISDSQAYFVGLLPDGTFNSFHVIEQSLGTSTSQTTSLVFDSSDNAHVAYGFFRPTGNEVHYASRVGGVWNDSETAVSGKGVDGFASIAVDPSDNPHIAFHNSTEASLQVVSKSTSWSKPFTVDNPSDALNVSFAAGDGGSSGKAGAGGTISGLTIFDGASDFSIVAGNGGAGSVSGAAGGNVSQVSIGADSVVRVVAAGDGGNTTLGKAKGAIGGSVSALNVLGDVGYKAGKSYGFATDGTLMGGIFAGRGGVNTVTPLDTKLIAPSGNVSNVTAQAISAIVAGRDASPQLVNKVDGIFLGGNTPATVNLTGAFNNFAAANIVGGKAGDPALPNAQDFHFSVGPSFAPSGSTFSPWTLGTTQPLDGLIAALSLTSNRNFTPLAFLTNTVSDPKAPPVYGLYVPTLATA